MSIYMLLTNAVAVQTSGQPPNPVKPDGPSNPNMPTLRQTFQLIVTGTAGNVSATVQPLVSNDGVNWTAYGDPLIAASTYLTAMQNASMEGSWKYFGAYLSAISGTGAAATLSMNA